MIHPLPVSITRSDLEVPQSPYEYVVLECLLFVTHVCTPFPDMYSHCIKRVPPFFAQSTLCNRGHVCGDPKDAMSTGYV